MPGVVSGIFDSELGIGGGGAVAKKGLAATLAFGC